MINNNNNKKKINNKNNNNYNKNNHHHHHVLYLSKTHCHIAIKQNIFNLMVSGNNRKLSHGYIHRTGSR